MKTLHVLTGLAICLTLTATGPTLAQVAGSAGGGGAGSGVSGASGGVGSGAAGGVGSSPAGSSAISGSDAGGGLGGGGGLGTGDIAGPSTQELATEGSTTINNINADSIARSGDVGAATGFGGSGLGATGTMGGTTTATGEQSISGAGPDRLYQIPRPRVEVDLNAIRSALSAGPSATPKPDGR